MSKKLIKVVEPEKTGHTIVRIGILKLRQDEWVTIGRDESTGQIVPMPDMPCNPYEKVPS